MTNGPYDTEAQAHSDAAPLLAAAGSDAGEARVRYVMEAVAAAGVEAGAFDRRIGSWLGETAEPEALAVIAGWIRRAHAAGCAEAELNLAPSEPASPGSAEVELEAEFPDPEA
jgi:hypothetical protein